MAHIVYEGFPAFERNSDATPSAPAYPPPAVEKGLSVRDKVEIWNCLTVFNVIRQRGPVTQADIIEETNLSSGAVSQFVTLLADKGLVGRVPDEWLPREAFSSVGRKRVYWDVSDATGYVIAIDIGQTHLRVVVADLRARLKTAHTSGARTNSTDAATWNLSYFRNFRLADGPDRALAYVGRVVRDHLKRLNIPLDANQIVAIAVGIPGHVDTARQTVYMPVAAGRWSRVNVALRLAQALGISDESGSAVEAIPIFVENNANLGVIGVTHHPGLRSSACQNDMGARAINDEPQQGVIYVKVGASIEAGLFLNRALYRGGQGVAGDIGHFQVREEGVLPCACGRKHCLDMVAGSEAVIAASKIARDDRLPRDLIERVVQGAVDGDEHCRAAIATAGSAVGQALVSLIKTLNPTEIVVDGAIVHSEGHFLNAMRAAVDAGIGEEDSATGSRAIPVIRDLHKNAHAINYGGIYCAIEGGWQAYVIARAYPNGAAAR